MAGRSAGEHSRGGKRTVLTVATWLWVGMFVLRLGVQVPFYVAEQAAALAATKLLMGLPLYAAVLWVTWLMVRAVYARGAASTASAGDAVPEAAPE